MDHKQRHKRLRLLINKLNKDRKRQAKKIDILCNDIIAAQRSFIQALNTVSFAEDFYRSIIGVTDLNKLLNIADRYIRDEIPDANVTFFLRQADGFKLHMSGNSRPITLEKHRLENCLNGELAEAISQSNKILTLDDMFAMGLQSNKIGLSKLSAVTVPLGDFPRSAGFILIYRTSSIELTSQYVDKISAVTCGLSQAIQACHVALQSTN